MLRLNDEKTKVNLKIDDGKTFEFIVKTEDGKLNIYFPPSPTSEVPHNMIEVQATPTPKIISDCWVKDDSLGYEAYARAIVHLITNDETVPPLTIGIKAPWGTGKTSLMRMVQDMLDGDAVITEENNAVRSNLKTEASITLRDLLTGLEKATQFEPPLYWFSWDKIPGNDNEKLIEFLKQNFNIDGVANIKYRIH